MGAISLLERQHLRQLLLIFCAWKSLLLLLAAFCPGPGYDTSALILLDSTLSRHQNFHNLPRHDRLVLNLFRWDAFYFAQSAQRGYMFEQEWAFSRTYSSLLRWTLGRTSAQDSRPLQQYVVAGIVFSHVFHFMSVLVLYYFSARFLVLQNQRHIAFVASVLHILTPASLFYSAPYAEALFALLNLLGMLCYTRSKAVAKARSSPFLEDALKIISGLIFASATLFRSNGLLNGVIYLYDVVRYLPLIMSWKVSVSDFRRIIVTCIAGSFIAAGFIGPQYVAYVEFCDPIIDSEARPWCEKRFPSVYSWVQSHYWNVGFLRYWTLPNIPLFLLAAPMLWMLLESGATFVFSCFQQTLHVNQEAKAGETPESTETSSWEQDLPELALPQLMLAILAIASFHVQIVNRIASAYPIWYVTISACSFGRGSISSAETTWLQHPWVIRSLIMYALIQGMLYAYFLPPA